MDSDEASGRGEAPGPEDAGGSGEASRAGDAADGDGETSRNDGDGEGERRHPADRTVRSDTLPDAVRCPHCGEEESEQFSSFGSAVSVSQYYCRSCRTVFEAFKWR